MNTHEGHNSRSRKPGAVVHARSFRISPLAQAMALALAAGAATTAAVPAHAQRAFSPTWFNAKGAAQATATATGMLPNGMPVASLMSPAGQQQRANEQLQQSIGNLNLAARGIAAQQAAQAAARAAAQNDPSVPDGLAEGGLKVDTNSLTAGWLNARPLGGDSQKNVDGRTVVTVEQTADKAILNWETFNVGKNTTVAFAQQKDWAVLNKVNDPQARPSQIQGRIKADGTVMVANRNGIVFSGTSQVDTRNLVAAATQVDDAQFQSSGVYGNGLAPNFRNANGRVEVQAGARISTPAPTSATQGGGYVLLLGSEVRNAGEIATPSGQTLMAAGDSFSIRKGVGTEGNQASTTRGNEVAVTLAADSKAGLVVNTGLIQAPTGDVTLAGREVVQNGVILSSTSVNTRGTVHLAAVGTAGKVTLGEGSTTAVVLDTSGTTALDSQRTALMAPAVLQDGQNFSLAGNDRRDLSRVEVASGGTVEFQKDSLTLATGGQVVVDAKQRSLVREGARIDVSGAVGVKLTMESNNVKINVQGNEQRDAPLNRDSKNLNNNDLWIDRRTLVFVPGGTNGYQGERWYTGGGLLEVGGYLGTQGHTVGEWMAQGGAVSFTGGDVVTQRGSSINLSGGTLDVLTGTINQSWLKGADGRLYEVSKAPGDLKYTGVYKGFEDEHVRWGKGTTGFFYNPLIGPQKRLENGYTVGRDAGVLIVGTKGAVLEGDIVGETFQGDRQTQAPQAGLDGYRQSSGAAPQRGQLVVGSYDAYFDKSTGTLYRRLDPAGIKNVVLGNTAQAIAAELDLSTALPAERRDTLYLDTDQLSGFRLGAVRVAATESIAVTSALQAGNGGNITLYGPSVKVDADLVAHGGSIQLGNVLEQISNNYLKDTTYIKPPADGRATVVLAGGARLDTSGLWANVLKNPLDAGGLAYRNGGSVSVRSTGDVVLGSGSLVDVSSGAGLLAKAKQQGGKGGSVTLEADGFNSGNGHVVLDGAALRGHGVDGGGTLTVQANRIAVGDTSGAVLADMLMLGADFFDKGFSRYALIGNHGLTVADGAQIDVTMPVLRFGANAQDVATGGKPADALEAWTPPLYQEDAAKAVLTQRKGASLSLQAGTATTQATELQAVQAVVGKGAAINVDPGQAIEVRSTGQLTVEGTLRASAGRIVLKTVDLGDLEADKANAQAHARSIWIGEQAVLDVSARAATATDVNGKRYGLVRDGGSILIGGEIDTARGMATATQDFIVVRPGALLDASGTHAVLDVPGMGATDVASNGGSISLASYNGLYLDGTLRAFAGGQRAAGGTLSVALDTPGLRLHLDPLQQAEDRVRRHRVLVLGNEQGAPLAPDTLRPGVDDGALEYGQARLGADTVRRGGFDNLSLFSGSTLALEDGLDLRMRQSLQIYAGGLALGKGAPDDAQVALSGAYVRLAGSMTSFTREVLRAPSAAGGVARVPSGTRLTLSGDLIDVRDGMGFGVAGKVAMLDSQSESPVLDLAAFGQVTLDSTGDLRFLQGRLDVGTSTSLIVPGSLTLRAAQIYPATGVVALVSAGMGRDGKYRPDTRLRIEGTGTTPAVPYSAFGDLTMRADVIEQGGVVRTPLGHLTLGDALTTQTRLLPGSVTSVSGEGLSMPYGGTVDGINYLYNGKQVTLTGVGAGDSFNRNLTIGLSFMGASVQGQEGATLDLSGGGNLTGTGFVSGRGGSTDARFSPLMQVGANGGFTLPGLATNPVYAVVPGVQPAVAPTGAEKGAVDPLVGQQITIGAGVPGLPAGTYTLMPSTYALQKGAFRVELNGAAGLGASTGTQAMRNGSWLTAAQLGVGRTGIGDTLFRQAIVTSADVLRSYSQYNETGYADFVRADALRVGVPRAMLPADARNLHLRLEPGAGAEAFRFAGIARFQPAEGGRGGSVTADGSSATTGLEVVAAGAPATPGFKGVTYDAGALSGMNVSRLVIGGLQAADYGQGGSVVKTGDNIQSVVVRQGAVLSAPEVFLGVVGTGAESALSVVVEQGAHINTIGRGKAAYDAADGFVYDASGQMLMVSNGRVSTLPVPASEGTRDNRSLQVGVCSSASCSGQTELYSEGTIAMVTPDRFEMGDAVRYGTRHLTLAVRGINVGDNAVLAAAAANNTLPPGLAMSQSVLDRLLRGDRQYGAPALETLELSASGGVNFFGTAALDTLDPATGKSTMAQLVLATPAIYGQGGADDVATIRTGRLVWQSMNTAPTSVASGGAGTGGGTLNIEAERIEFGYGPNSQPSGRDDTARLVLGFADVNLKAGERVSANHKGSLSVYQSQGAYDAGNGYAYSGGNLNIVAPLLTGEAGSVNRITAGGALRVSAPSGAAVAATGDAALGAELSLRGHDVTLDTAVALPSGKLTVSAERDLTLTDRAVLDLAGRKLAFNDVTKYSAGGDLVLESLHGNLRQAAGSVIDISAQNNRAGTLKAMALDDAAGASTGVVDLQGRILGASSGRYDAGGTLVPFLAGSVEVRARQLGDAEFAALNQRLNDGGVFGARSFQLRQGDLTIGNGVKAGEVNVSLDKGSLTVTGTIDASGERVGRINLAAGNSLTLAGSAVLDAHGSTLRVDSHGKIIDSPNRAMVELTSNNGQLTLASGARIDLRHGTNAKAGGEPGQNDGMARGTLELNAGRTGETSGDIRIDASGSIAIEGARSIAVNGTWRYDDARFGTDTAASGRPYQVIDQAYLDAKHLKSTAFIDNALANTALMNGRLAGLNNARYADAFHLRPGVEIVSRTPDGDMVVQGDIDLSGYRYASANPHTQKTGVYGSGEVGKLAIRAGGNLDIFGSINDGFMPPPATQDDRGWLLLPGTNLLGGDVVVPRGGVVLADGTVFEGGVTLNYDLPIRAAGFDVGQLIPAPSVLAAPLELKAGTVLSADVRDASGALLYAAGSIVSGANVTLPVGTRLGAGMRLPSNATLSGVVWPKGVPLPGDGRKYVMNGAVTLPLGAVLPAGTDIKLPEGVDSVNLRPDGAGRLWAAAAMLPEGSQSWSVRLLAGADLDAADNRIVQVHPAAGQGNLRLADSHYGLFGKLLPPKGTQLWTQFAQDDLAAIGIEVKAGEPIDAQWLEDMGAGTIEALCAGTPAYCVLKSAWGWSQKAVDELAEAEIVVKLGDPVDPAIVGNVDDFCMGTPTYCVSANKPEYAPTPASVRFSVVRTGTADLDLRAAGNLRMDSLFGVYTAGASSQATRPGDPYNLPRAVGPNGTVLNDVDGGYEKFVDGGAQSLARAWYPASGGNLTLKVGGDLSGDIMLTRSGSGAGRPNPDDKGFDSSAIGNWLWRQGTGGTFGGAGDQATAWWINFGSYAGGGKGVADKLLGFTGFGTLGGGDLLVDVGGNAGTQTRRGVKLEGFTDNQRSQGIVLAVGGTGRVLADGSLSLTGGGDVQLRVGGALNPLDRPFFQGDGGDVNAALNGVVVNLRGDVQLQAGSIGSLPLTFGTSSFQQSPRETRAFDPYTATRGMAQGGIVLAPGDASYTVSTRGDLVVKGVIDPTRESLPNATPFSANGLSGQGKSWFSLWTPNTAINLLGSGGNLVPVTGSSGIAATDSAYVYPSILSAVAASGSLFYGDAATAIGTGSGTALLLAPSANGRLEFLAGDSIYAGGNTVSQSGAAAAALATPLHPGFTGTASDGTGVGNLSGGNRLRDATRRPLFAFGADTVSGEAVGNAPARFYAVHGDLIGVSSGRVMRFTNDDVMRKGQTWYDGAQPVWMMAGRDIVSSGTPIGQADVVTGFEEPSFLGTGNLFVHRKPGDISVVSAGRDILFSTFNVAGPGTLEITAGRDIRMENKASVSSLGSVVPGDSRPGASIAMLAGVGAGGADYAGFAQRYLDPANLMQSGQPLADQPGKVVKNYNGKLRLADWLRAEYGYSGDEQGAAAWMAQRQASLDAEAGKPRRVLANDYRQASQLYLVNWLEASQGYVGNGGAQEALAFFNALPPEQQRSYLRGVYFAELREGGREYNDENGVRYGSYLRGRNTIASLFPGTSYKGDITMFGSAGINTLFGGDIALLTPGGRQVFGIEGAAPKAVGTLIPGVITQGAGDISLYSLGSILLGQSRIMTTFGGGVLGWSAEGDINAGRGSKTTLVYTPPKRVYDRWGNVVLSSDVPSTGAGIATLNPIPEVPAGDIDLIAPLGTIDAGEAGIRVSGNVNLAALHVVNADNVQVQGKSTGLPMVASVNVGALSNASAAASQASAAAQDVLQRERAAQRQALPSVFTVRVLGFGDEPAGGAPGGGEVRRKPAEQASYDPSGFIQMVGHGALTDAQIAKLSENERRGLPRGR
ncbi:MULTISPECIES: filamentous haemagglutinin family protein [Variovorax]|jgi:filamentous hemagglutinin family protein|uniref:filamentous haemagglutinin family protein n=1 Tax=Variovorax TaxID=34072 RepID=UPI000A4E890F|nr:MULTISPECIES: filamentous haemagglutinin family protein [Variovorax]UKI05516.1 filamentous hemagglutinin family protein [Variovorax paradoxus]